MFALIFLIFINSISLFSQEFTVILDTSIFKEQDKIFVTVSESYQIVNGRFKQITEIRQFPINENGDFIKYMAGTTDGFKDNRTIFIRPNDILLVSYNGKEIDATITNFSGTESEEKFQNEFDLINSKFQPDNQYINDIKHAVQYLENIKNRLTRQLDNLDKYKSDLTKEYTRQAEKMIVTESAFQALSYFNNDSSNQDYTDFLANHKATQLLDQILDNFLAYPPPKELGYKYNQALLAYCKFKSLSNTKQHYDFPSIYRFISDNLTGAHQEVALTTLMLENVNKEDFQWIYYDDYKKKCSNPNYILEVENHILMKTY